MDMTIAEEIETLERRRKEISRAWERQGYLSEEDDDFGALRQERMSDADRVLLPEFRGINARLAVIRPPAPNPFDGCR